MSQDNVIEFFSLIFDNGETRAKFNDSFVTAVPEKLRLIGEKNDFNFPQEIISTDESVINFLKAANQNKDIQIEINSLFVSEASEIVVQIGQDYGYSFTADELKAVMNKTAGNLDSELSEKELAEVAGGLVNELGDSSLDPAWSQGTWGQGTWGQSSSS